MYGTSFGTAVTALAIVALHGAAASPQVTFSNGTVIGTSLFGIDSFKGIPFAQPPVGPLRLKPPQVLNASFGNLTLPTTPAQCPQFSGSGNATAVAASLGVNSSMTLVLPPQNLSASSGQEDCLTLNVQRPSFATSSSRLPVVVWIYGGGFTFGSTQSYDGTPIIEAGALLGAPLIFVAMNYRVGGFGFLAGSEIQADGSTNLGLRDQRLALEWVQDNIAAFGGDPTKVTIWGESAGSASVFDQMLINGGDNSYKNGNLFRAAIMDSGSVFATLPVTAVKQQQIYNSVVELTGCANSTSTLTCLRSVPYSVLYQAISNNQGDTLIDANYFPRPDPSSAFFSQSQEAALAAGKITKVPFIIGDQEDEGTLFTFTRTDINSTGTLVNAFAAAFPSTPVSLVADLVATYPDDLTAGSPFDTGIFNEIYPQYKRASAIIGDTSFTLTRRLLLAALSSQVTTYSYLSTYFHDLIPVLGTTHATDILAIYFGLATPLPVFALRTYYASFITTMNPNTLASKVWLPNWPQYTTANPVLQQFDAVDITTSMDIFRATSYQFIVDNISSFKI